MDRWKAEMGRFREEKRREEFEERRLKKRKPWKKEAEGARKGIKVAKHCVLPNDLWLWMVDKLDGGQVGSLKRRVQSHLARWKLTSCTPLWCKADVEVKMYKMHPVRTTFGSWDWDVEKVRAVVARSTFRSQNVLGPGCNMCRLQDLVPDGGVPMGKGLHGQHLGL